MYKYLAVALLPLVLAACASNPAPSAEGLNTPAPSSSANASLPHAAHKGAPTAYLCEGKHDVLVSYEAGTQGHAVLELPALNGNGKMAMPMTRMRSAKGRLYTGDESNVKSKWHIQGRNGVLFSQVGKQPPIAWRCVAR